MQLFQDRHINLQNTSPFYTTAEMASSLVELRENISQLKIDARLYLKCWVVDSNLTRSFPYSVYLNKIHLEEKYIRIKWDLWFTTLPFAPHHTVTWKHAVSHQNSTLVFSDCKISTPLLQYCYAWVGMSFNRDISCFPWRHLLSAWTVTQTSPTLSHSQPSQTEAL